MYVLNNYLKKNRKFKLYAPGGICYVYWDKQEELKSYSCNGRWKCRGYYEGFQLDREALQMCECEQTTVYEPLRTGITSGPAQVFPRYYENDITHIGLTIYGENQRLRCKFVLTSLLW